MKRRIAKHLPTPLHLGPFAGFEEVPLLMDVDCVQNIGKESLWPLFPAQNRLSEWLDVCQLELAYQQVVRYNKDIRPLRKLQSAQALAYRLLELSTG